MAKIYNSDLTKGIADNAKIQINVDRVPDQLADKVVPVMETNPRLLRIAKIAQSGALTNATSATIYTVPNGVDLYITSACLSMTKDATSTSTVGTMRALTEDGIATTSDILVISGITLTAQHSNVCCSFDTPIKISGGNTVRIISGTNVANIIIYGSFTGYLVQNTNA